MNARMVVTVPMNDIPNKITEIILSASDKLSQISNECYYCSVDVNNNNDLLAQLEILDQIRKKLSVIDLNIEDCYSVLKGYISYQIQNSVEQENENVASDQGSGS